MNKGWERVFYVLSFIFQGSSYMSPRAYAIMHRLHHAHTDTDLDPHSPSTSSNLFLMMWRTRNYYRAVLEGKIVADEKYLKNLPDWPWFDRWATGNVAGVIWIAIYTAIFVNFATSPWQYIMLPIIIAMGVFHGVIINWFAHKYGYINYKLKNTSMNLLVVDFLMLGECYHNNHHKYASSANFGRKWHEIDPVYHVIRLFALLRIIQMPNLATVNLPVAETANEHATAAQVIQTVVKPRAVAAP